MRAGPLVRRISALTPILLLAGTALAQPDDATQRELVRRQQQSDEFSQQLRQSQEMLRVPPGDQDARRRMESKHLEQRQQLEKLNAEQLQRAGKDVPPALWPQQRSRMYQERRPLVDAPPEDAGGK